MIFMTFIKGLLSVKDCPRHAICKQVSPSIEFAC